MTCDEFLSSILQKRCFYSLLLWWCAFIVLRWGLRRRENEREFRRKNTNTRVIHVIYTREQHVTTTINDENLEKERRSCVEL